MQRIMTFRQVMVELKKLGTAQNRKIYKNHGGGDNVYGVSYANLYKIQKKIKTDHDLAMKLYQSNVVDAMVLGLLIADPKKLSRAEAEGLVKVADFSMVCFYIGRLVAKSGHWKPLIKKWTKSKKEYVRSAGYVTLSSVLRDNADEISDAYALQVLKIIEKEIHGSPNIARYSMNNAVIAIGTYKDGVYKEAIAAAKRIGKVHVDHKKTNCKTPEAVSYIKKARAHRKKKKKK